ncbi:O-methyltransferase [soil metagenome]
MTQKTWDAVDDYINTALVKPDAALAKAAEASIAAQLPDIAVAPNQGKLLMLLAMSIGAKRILEIGTLGGYSTIWLARALPPGGRLISLEADPHHAAVARANIEAAGLSGRVEIRIGRAIETLPAISEGPFDFCFIDADKPGNPDYFAWALKLSRRGSIIVVDNVVRGGDVADEKSRDPSVLGVRRLNTMIAAEKRVVATAIQTVGAKGHDGFAIALVTSEA